MPCRAATITQADVVRVRAAKQVGAAEVEVRPDGTIIVRLHEPCEGKGVSMSTAPAREIVL